MKTGRDMYMICAGTYVIVLKGGELDTYYWHGPSSTCMFLLFYASSVTSGETVRMCRLVWVLNYRIFNYYTKLKN